MESVINALIIGIIATLLFEILKFILIKVWDRIIESRIPFSLTGYWVAFIETKHPDTHKVYSAFELVRLRIKRGTIIVKIYQTTDDSRMHKYKGIGYLRGSKLSLSYEDYYNPHSELCGSCILKVIKKSEHNICLTGAYTEFQGNADIISTHDYSLYPYALSRKEKIALRLFGEKYIFNLMEKNKFEKNVKKIMQ